MEGLTVGLKSKLMHISYDWFRRWALDLVDITMILLVQV